MYFTTGREVVAFSVALTHAATVLGGTKILFNHTLYDTNCDYDRSAGNFVASSTGPYEFNFHLTGHPHGGTIWFELWKNERYELSNNYCLLRCRFNKTGTSNDFQQSKLKGIINFTSPSPSLF